jgi:aminoglycoside phosphotransferase (APT) family kinase protein
MSDWELASLGDPAGDLQFSEGTFQLGDFDELLAHYESRTGSPISLERLAFGAFLVCFKTFVCNRCFMLRCHTDLNDPRLTSITFGELYAHRTYRRLASCIGRDLVSAWHEIKTHEEPIYATFQSRKR